MVNAHQNQKFYRNENVRKHRIFGIMSMKFGEKVMTAMLF